MMATAPIPNPSFFKALIGEFESKLRIPPLFVKYVFKGRVPTVFTLSSSDSESSWRVRVRAERGIHFFLGGGWSKFVQDHGLEMGDFLLFFLVGSSTFDVITYNRNACSRNIIVAADERKNVGRRPPSVFRRTEETPTKRCSSVPNKGKGKGVSSTSNIRRAVDSKSEETRKHDSFKMVMKEHERYQIVLPRKFARKTGLEKESITKVKDPRGNIWLINTILCGDQVRLGRGWAHFVHLNEIAVGDTLLFEHIESEGNLLRAQVVNKRAQTCEENTKPAGNRGRGRPRRQDREPPSSSKRKRDLISEQISFDMVLKVYQKYDALLPKGFAAEMGLVEEPSTVIKGSDGRKWPVNILVDARSYVRFGRGWSKFVEDNELEVGDTIRFWHIPNTGKVINFKTLN